MDFRIKVLRCKNRFIKKAQSWLFTRGFIVSGLFSSSEFIFASPLFLQLGVGGTLSVPHGMWVPGFEFCPSLWHCPVLCPGEMLLEPGAAQLCFHKTSRELPWTALFRAGMKNFPLHFFRDFYAPASNSDPSWGVSSAGLQAGMGAGCCREPPACCSLSISSHKQTCTLSLRQQFSWPMDSKVCLSLLYYCYLLPQCLFGRRFLCLIPALLPIARKFRTCEWFQRPSDSRASSRIYVSADAELQCHKLFICSYYIMGICRLLSPVLFSCLCANTSLILWKEVIHYFHWLLLQGKAPPSISH